MDDIDRRIDRLLASIEADRKAFKERLDEEKKEFEKGLKALKESHAETERLLKESIAEAKERTREREEEEKKRRALYDKKFEDFGKELGGIANSNGEFAEEYFENIFCRDLTFAGMHFHDIIMRKKFDDRTRKDEFDMIMLNEDKALIVETKYKAKESDIDKVIKKAESFRYWYPEYAGHNVYLCLASLRFEENIINKARKKGIAIVQQLGDKTVVNDEHLKAY